MFLFCCIYKYSKIQCRLNLLYEFLIEDHRKVPRTQTVQCYINIFSSLKPWPNGNFESNTVVKARRTLELSAQQNFTRASWRKQVSQVCGAVLWEFRLACHFLRIFNMLNNFGHEWTFPQVCARAELSAQHIAQPD